MSRNEFYVKRQAPGESVSAFVITLRRAARLCNFEGQLEKMLHDRLVGGLWDEKLQRRLYAKGNLTFRDALEEALAVEAAARTTMGARRDTAAHETLREEDSESSGTSGSEDEGIHKTQRRPHCQSLQNQGPETACG